MKMFIDSYFHSFRSLSKPTYNCSMVNSCFFKQKKQREECEEKQKAEKQYHYLYNSKAYCKT